jgi:hypothetical protein
LISTSSNKLISTTQYTTTSIASTSSLMTSITTTDTSTARLTSTSAATSSYETSAKTNPITSTNTTKTSETQSSSIVTNAGTTSTTQTSTRITALVSTYSSEATGTTSTSTTTTSSAFENVISSSTISIEIHSTDSTTDYGPTSTYSSIYLQISTPNGNGGLAQNSTSDASVSTETQLWTLVCAVALGLFALFSLTWCVLRYKCAGPLNLVRRGGRRVSRVSNSSLLDARTGPLI